jgi:multicomponent Na+:H+ antiporter subunit C
MKTTMLFSIAGIAVFFIGLYCLMAYRHLLKKIIAVNVMGTGVFLFIVSIAARANILQPDPVPHAMVLTGIVVTVSATAFGLALFKRIYSETGKPYLDNEDK